MISQIPEELKALQQWVCFDVLEDKKIPFIPGSDNQAASNRPRDWRSFRAALADVESGKRQYLGFCFSSSDPYTFIDLDDIDDKDQRQIFERLDTYCQRSISGEGCHLICNGTFEGKGKHPAQPAAGIFKQNRFCLMTGDVVAGRDTINVVSDADLQAVHSWLGGGRDSSEVPLVEYQADLPDQTVFDLGCDRFLKFSEMCCGRWQQYSEFHNDHSTADHAFLAMLCDLTSSNEQVRWLFSHSGMWNEERAAKKSGHGFDNYVNRTISKIRSSQSRDAERASRVTLCFEERDEPEIEEATVVAPVGEPEGSRDLLDSIPPGLLRDLADYSFATAYLPLQEASLLGPLSFISALCGRGYVTPDNSGLNLWLILVGRTGCGKDELQKSVKRILSGVSKQLPHVRRIFGGELVSGPAVETTFQETLRYISYFKEFGKTFSTLASPNPQEHTRSLVGSLLNSYNAADVGGSIECRKKAKNEGEKPYIERPCLCVMGDSTPGELYGAVSTRELASGFLQRFMLFEVKPESWSLHSNSNSGLPLPKKLADKLGLLAEMMERFDADARAVPTRVRATAKAQKMLSDYALNKRKAIRRNTGPQNSDEVYNRAGLKVARLATIVAVCADFHSPLIEEVHAQWAIELVERLDAQMLAKFSTGEVGTGQVKQEAEILGAAVRLSKLTLKERAALGMVSKVAKAKDFIPLSVLKAEVIQRSSFENDKAGAVTAFERCVASMVRAGVFSQVDENYASDNFDHFKKGSLLCLTQ